MTEGQPEGLFPEFKRLGLGVVVPGVAKGLPGFAALRDDRLAVLVRDSSPGVVVDVARVEDHHAVLGERLRRAALLEGDRGPQLRLGDVQEEAQEALFKRQGHTARVLQVADDQLDRE